MVHRNASFVLTGLLTALVMACPGEVDAFVPGQPAAAAARGRRARTIDIVGVRARLERLPPPAARAVSATSSDAPSDRKTKGTMRPLTQQWWPVSLTSRLDPARPNPAVLLNKKLVFWYDASSSGGDRDEGGGSWSCLDDRCAHRFAPLSEGRVVTNATATGSSCLQCAYHGWEFDGRGGCARIPQAMDDRATTSSNKGLCAVQSYPVRECAGMIWVWADPEIEPDEDQDPQRSISNLLRRFDAIGGTARGFQRDLPYGMEFLGENLVDISHLPFSHHSVGTLNRADGRPVPLEMLNATGKIETARLQNNQDGKLPLYQARIVNAAEGDPEIVAALKYNPLVRAEADPDLATSTIGFYDPCHVRYNRNQGIPGSSYEINLFMCPTTEGNSRVFLFTPFEKILPKEGDGEDGNSSAKVPTAVPTWSRPNVAIRRSVFKLFGRKALAPFPPHLGHMISHRIFDGDGIFLNKQGDRMKRGNLTPKDYYTPTSSDVMVNAFRRWLDKAAEVTRAAGDEQAATSATGDGGSAYTDNRPRAELLDRYTSHTAGCSICQAALKSLKDKRDRLSLLSTTLIGATGASGVVLACAAMFSIMARVLVRELAPRAVALKMALSVMISTVPLIAASWTGAKKTKQQIATLNKEIQQFYFEDYVHAEKE